MGAWRYLRPRLEQLEPLATGGVALRYAGRPPLASPAEGFQSQHQTNQERIVRRAFGEEAELPHGGAGTGVARSPDPGAGGD